MRILVTGANGQLGNELRIVSLAHAHEFIFTDICEASGESLSMLAKLTAGRADCSTEKLDITDLDALRKLVAEKRIDCIINCAAFTNVDAAESNPELAQRLNADAPANLASAMKEVGGLLVHISTDYVFGKEPYNTPCSEDREGTPTGVYGWTKLEGEKAILESGCRSLILRTGWMYSEFGKNFCRTMLSLTESRPELRVVFDQVGTPTYARDLSEAIMTMLDDARLEDKLGIYNFSNEGVCSWFDFARAIAEYSGHVFCDLRPCHSNEFPSNVVRPSYSVLDKTKIKDSFGIRVPYWTDSLKKCLSRM